MYNVDNMTEQVARKKTPLKPKETAEDTAAKKKSSKWLLIIGIASVVLTVLMCVAIIVYKDEVKELANYGYLGAFFISILGGATVIVPVPMLAIVFALGGVMPMPWLVAISAALGETVGALTIYFTGRGAGHALSNTSHGWLQRWYDKLMNLMQRRGAITLFIVTSIINPFFYPAAFAAGALKFGFKKYIPIVLAGKLIKSFTVVYAGFLGIKFIFHWFGIDI